jgi:hypothetical protein
MFFYKEFKVVYSPVSTTPNGYNGTNSSSKNFALHKTAATTLVDVIGCCEVLVVSTEDLTRLTPERDLSSGRAN